MSDWQEFVARMKKLSAKTDRKKAQTLLVFIESKKIRVSMRKLLATQKDTLFSMLPETCQPWAGVHESNGRTKTWILEFFICETDTVEFKQLGELLLDYATVEQELSR